MTTEKKLDDFLANIWRDWEVLSLKINYFLCGIMKEKIKKPPNRLIFLLIEWDASAADLKYD
jgi:hypothetical protein